MTKHAMIIGLVVAYLCHLTLGWQYSVIGAIVAGFLAPKKGVRAGALSLGLGWGLLIIFNFVVATPETVEMTRIMAALLGGLPSFVTVLLTLLIGLLLGTIGGWVGSALKSTRDRSKNG